METKDKTIILTGVVGVVFVTGLILNEYIDSRDRSIHASAYNLGFNTAIAEGKPTTIQCMAFWFNGDMARVTNAVKKIKLNQ